MSMARLVMRSSAVNEQLMHPLGQSVLLILCLMTSGCVSPVLSRHFHVDPSVVAVEAGPDADLASSIHDEAVRSGRALGWVDAPSVDSAALRLSYAWRREAGAVSDRFRLVCLWRTSEGVHGEVTDGQAMPGHFWTESRAGAASSRLCAFVIRTSGNEPRHVP